MNSKKHKLPRRILAMLLAICMFVTMFPSAMFAVEGGGNSGSEPETVQTVTSNDNNGIKVNKSVTGDANSGYKLTLEAYAEETIMTTEKPLNIVLVLDTSGSMDDNLENPVYKSELEQSKTYWIYLGLLLGWQEVQHDGSGWYYNSIIMGKQYVEPKASAQDNTGYQFYERQSKMSAMKDAVNSFIDGISAEEVAKNTNIAIVSFAYGAVTKKELTPVTTGKESLKTIVNSLSADGATAADEGLSQAKSILSNQSNAENVVIMFTDGEPNNSSGFDSNVANDAIENAGAMKDSGVDIYTVGMFENADPNDLDQEFNKYMNYVSSNYPDAASLDWGGQRGSGNYYLTADSAASLNEAFESIYESISSLKVSPDEDSVLSDTLSEYFNFPEGLSGSSSGIEVKYMAATQYVYDAYQFEEKTDELASSPTVEVEGDTITVGNFNYKDNALSHEGSTAKGGKLVITFPIEVDNDACITDAEKMKSVYPTNDTEEHKANLYYKGENADTNNTKTELDQSPTVYLPVEDLSAQGTSVTIEVYLDGEPAENPRNLVNLTRYHDGKYTVFTLESEAESKLTYGFNYYKGEGGHDCVDIKAVPAEGYALQAVEYFQSYGSGKPQNVTEPTGANNFYLIDNVTGVNNRNDVDCRIYLSTEYTAQYYQGETTRLEDAPYNDTNTYVGYERDVEFDNQPPTEENETLWRGWEDDLKTQINLPELKDAGTGMTEDGWFLGSISGEKKTPNSTIEVADVKSGADENNVIKFYETTAAANHSITINYVNGDNKEENLGDKTWTQAEGSAYTITLDREGDASGNGKVPFIIQYNGKQYVFDKFSDSPELTGTVGKEDLTFTAEYLLDEKGPDGEPDGVPDKYQAFVTYKIENGTWKDGSDSQVETFDLYDFTDNQWVKKEPAPTLKGTIPDTNTVKPDEDFIKEGSWKDNEEPDTDTPAVDGAVYTYVLVAKKVQLNVEKEIYSINGTTVDSQDGNTAKIGDTIIYKIEISNEGSNVAITGIKIVDTLTVGKDTEKLTTLYSDPSCDPDKVANLEELSLEKDAKEPLTLYAKYEVTEAGQDIKNAVEVTSKETGEDPVIDETPSIDVTSQYDLIYDPNGGLFTKSDGTTNSENVTVSGLQAGDYTLWQDQTLPAGYNSEGNPSYTTEENVLFMGWATKAYDGVFDLADKTAWSTYKDEKLIKDNKITLDADTTVYAVWAKDENGNGIADVEEDTYTLTYNSTSGSFGESESKTASVDNLLANAENESYTLWTGNETTADSEIVPADATFPSHANGENDVKILFAGWTTTQPKDGADYVFDQGDQNIPNRITTVTITNEPVTVYAVWGYDRNNNGEPDINEELYTLTYNPNGGTFGADGSGEPANATNVLANEDLMLWTKDDNGTKPDGDVAWPVHAEADAPEGSVIAQDGQKVDVVMIGWAKERGEKEIYAAGEAYPEIVSTVKIPPSDTEKSEEVFAIWGYDENGDGVADAQQIVITPADITIYTGGNGYGGIIDENGNVDTDGANEETSNGLPEPGYYLILPHKLDVWLNGDDANNTSNLADKLHLSYSLNGENRAWNLELYSDQDGADGNKVYMEDGRFYYVYRLVPEKDGQVPVRLEIQAYERDANGNILYDENGNPKYHLVTSDDFEIKMDELYQEFQMRLYNTPGLQTDAVTAEVKVNGSGKWTDVNDEQVLGADSADGIARGYGKLTIRGTTDNETLTDIHTAVPESIDGITAVASGETEHVYNINESDIAVDSSAKVQFLADDIVEDDASTQALKNAVVSDENTPITNDYIFDFSYLDLVDTNNGNAYVTLADEDKMSVDVYFPYPEGMGIEDTFYVVHYDQLDRNYADEQLDSLLTAENVKVYSADAAEASDLKLTNTEQGIKITTSTFSPFALVYDPDQNNGGNQGDGGWTPDGDDDGPSGLNTEDHFSYIVGYAEDYRTGEPTDNEDLWPVKPNNQITRAEVATIFYRLLEDEVRDEYDTTVNDFSDVSADSWYNQTVSTLASMEIVKGYEDGSFRPNAPITRAEFGAIATRFFAETGATYVPGTFTDVTGDEWYANAIQDAVNLGLIGGYPDGTVRPNNNITRAEACAIVNRTLGRVPDADHLLPEDVMKVWPDNNPTDWFYADMQEPTNGHEYAWIEEDGHEIEEWTNLLDKDWTDR